MTEGQAQVVWFDYTLAPMNKTILTAPEFVDAVRAQMGDSKDSPEFAKAPMFLQESLLMPYTFGLDFVRTVLQNKGKDAAFKGLLTDPPVDTRQIMQPETYLLHQVVPQLTIPNLDQMVAPTYTRFDFGGMGEFDIYLLAKQYGVKDPPNYYRHWRGGYYYAAQAKNGPKGSDRDAVLLALGFTGGGSDFARLYVGYCRSVSTLKPGMIVLDPTGPIAETPLAGEEPSYPLFKRYAGRHHGWPVYIQQHDNDLLIMEGYDYSVVQKAQQVLLYNMTLADRDEGKRLEVKLRTAVCALLPLLCCMPDCSTSRAEFQRRRLGEQQSRRRVASRRRAARPYRKRHRADLQPCRAKAFRRTRPIRYGDGFRARSRARRLTASASTSAAC